MEKLGAKFVISGEVLGQRPMSQRMDTMKRIEKESQLEGLIVRPLCGRILPPTIPEKEGLINREKLLDIKGRSRKVQFEIAKKYGLKNIQTPAGGCILTDPGFSRRLKKLLEIKKKPSWNEIKILRLGRVFEISQDLILVIPRNERESESMMKIVGEELKEKVIEVLEGTTIGVAIGNFSSELINTIGGIMLRYERKERGTIKIGDKTFHVKSFKPEEAHKLLV
ncbi:MAG: hypothetical protein ACPLSJ_05510 [Thermosulfidibacteraceae bacterium]|jgi:tRNA U34 2-thiouridine synthase MnmA/TrmU